MSQAGRRIEIRGTVQGVGFRPWIYRLARENGIGGRVSNDSRGVTIEAFGSDEALAEFLQGIRASPPPAARIRELECRAIPSEPSREFVIVASRPAAGLEVSIPPDLATCDDCLREVLDPGDRRYRYPFTNCTNCGPRFTIASRVPYDRAGDDHGALPDVRGLPARVRRPARPPLPRSAQRLPGVRPGPDGRRADGRASRRTDPIRAAARALAAGMIVAVKGLGGFHLACDATSARGGRAPAPPQAPRGKAARRHGGGARGGRGAGRARAGERELLRVAGAADRARAPAPRRGARAGGRARQPARSGSCSPTRRCTTCCSPTPAGRWS